MKSSSLELKALLENLDLYDPSTHFVDFDPIWYRAERINDVVNLIEAFLYDELSEILTPDNKNLLLISPINTRPDLGILPITVLLAERMKCSFAVWKEYADIKWGYSAIAGDKKSSYVCIILQHVVRQGTTGVRIAHLVAKEDLPWSLRAYVAVILNSVSMFGEYGVQDSLNEIEAILNHRPLFKRILSVEDLKG
jgi:hypothetical protein